LSATEILKSVNHDILSRWTYRFYLTINDGKIISNQNKTLILISEDEDDAFV
jgi:hypothetical protein